MHGAEEVTPRHRSGLIAISFRKGLNFLGYSRVLFILYGVVSVGTGSVWRPIERWVNPISAFLTLVGTLVTAASVYFYVPHTDPPERFSIRISAPCVIGATLVAIGSLCYWGALPPVIVNGFALLGISGALFRIQSRTTED